MKTSARKKLLGEVFTPPLLVEEILNRLPPETYHETQTYTDLAGCGIGNFLIGVKERIKHQSDYLDRIFGLDIMEDNCIETILRLFFDFPLYDQTGTMNEEHLEKLVEESERVSNFKSELLEVIKLKDIVEYYFSYQSDFDEARDKQKILEELKKTNNEEHYETVKRFLRPGLLALFKNKVTNQIIETIVQADGLVYDCSFGDRAMTPREIKEVRDESKPKQEEIKNWLITASATPKPKTTKKKVKGNLNGLFQ